MTNFKDRQLKDLYDEVWAKYKQASTFEQHKVYESRELFNAESLHHRSPVTNRLDVYALVSGLQFEKKIQESIANIQNDIGKILGKTLVFMVKPECLGVEFCILKWPEETYTKAIRDDGIKALSGLNASSFDLLLSGIQIHTDGCIVARGYDKGKLRQIRSYFKSRISTLPTRQSKWAHVPLGRILENPSPKIHRDLISYCQISHASSIGIARIEVLKFVHEKQWYMEDYELVESRRLK